MFKKTQQKLLGKLKNTPTDTSLVCSTVSSGLNKLERVSVQSKVLTNNIPEENKPQHTEGSKTKVYVRNKNGEPLMPCKPAKAKHLLKQGKARVVKRTPFTIQLLWDCENNTQDITLGIDAGYGSIGFSAVTGKQELISGEVILRKDIPKLIEQKRAYRRTRRGKLWHREARFNNRKIEKGWLAPSIKHKLDTHIRLIDRIKSLLPVTKTIIETANFDTQKMQNPEISGIEYQQGELQGYHIREYLLDKFGRKCIYCSKKDIPLEVEHIIPKSRKGSNRVSNLTISCRKCNLKKADKTAEEFGFPNIQKQAKESLKSTAFMNVVRKILAKKINAEETFGYITKYGRIVNNLDKSHVNDAFVIAEGSNQLRCKSYLATQTRRNNRSIQTNRKGFKPSIRRQRYKLQPNDLVKYEEELLRIKGTRSYGKYAILNNEKNVSIKNVELINYGKGLQFN